MKLNIHIIDESVWMGERRNIFSTLAKSVHNNVIEYVDDELWVSMVIPLWDNVAEHIEITLEGGNPHET